MAIVSDADVVKPEITGYDIKSTMNPKFRMPITKLMAPPKMHRMVADGRHATEQRERQHDADLRVTDSVLAER